MVAAPYDPDDFDHMLFIEGFKRVEASDRRPLPVAESITRTLRLLQLTPTGQRRTLAAPRTGESLNDLLAIGKALSAQYRYAEALTFFERATELDSDNFHAWINLGRCHMELEQNRQALAALERATRLDGNSEDAWFYLGATLNGLKAYDEAVAAFGRALALDPTYMFAWRGKVAALEGLGRTQEAEYAMRQAKALGWWV